MSHFVVICVSDFLSHVSLKLDGSYWKTIAHLLVCASLNSVYQFVSICGFKLELRSEMPKLGQNLFWPLWLQPLTSDLDLLHGYHFWQWWLGTGGQAFGTFDRTAWSQLTMCSLIACDSIPSWFDLLNKLRNLGYRIKHSKTPEWYNGNNKQTPSV